MPENAPRSRDPAPPGADAPELPVYERLLGQRLFANGLARFGVAALLVAGSWLVRSAMDLRSVNASALTVLAGVIAAYNILILLLNGRPAVWRDTVRTFRTRRALAHASIVLDFFALTVALWFVGGARSPFLAIFVLHIGIASILLPARSAALAALLAALLLTGLVVVETTGVLPPPEPAGLVFRDGPLTPSIVTIILAVYLGLFAVIVLAQTQLAETLRRSEMLAENRARQFESLSRMRRDFLHVALHDVASPIATAELLLRNLHDELCGPVEPRQKDQLARAMQRLAGMQQLVRDLRILGELETADLRAHSTEISLSFLLSSVMEDHADIGEEKGVKLTAEPSDLAAIVFGVPRLLQESIANYIDNAIKYTPRGGSVTARVRSAVEPGWFRVEVSDSGVGISAEDKSRLFAEFARVGRGHPALKNVHGTGLGLSIVRRIVESHGGRVGVESEPGHGSTFWLELPPCTGREDVPAENA